MVARTVYQVYVETKPGFQEEIGKIKTKHPIFGLVDLTIENIFCCLNNNFILLNFSKKLISNLGFLRIFKRFLKQKTSHVKAQKKTLLFICATVCKCEKRMKIRNPNFTTLKTTWFMLRCGTKTSR